MIVIVYSFVHVELVVYVDASTAFLMAWHHDQVSLRGGSEASAHVLQDVQPDLQDAPEWADEALQGVEMPFGQLRAT